MGVKKTHYCALTPASVALGAERQVEEARVRIIGQAAVLTGGEQDHGEQSRNQAADAVWHSATPGPCRLLPNHAIHPAPLRCEPFRPKDLEPEFYPGRARNVAGYCCIA